MLAKNLAALFFFFAALAFQAGAQTRSTVNFTVTDTNGTPYSNSLISVALAPTGGTAPTLTPCTGSPGGCRYQDPSPTSTNAAGQASFNLWQQASILPGGTSYNITVNFSGVQPPVGTGAQQCTVTGVTITTNPQTVTMASCPVIVNFGSSSGSGTVNAGSQYSIPEYPNSGSATVVGPSNIKTDATGNNISVPGNAKFAGPIPWVDVTAPPYGCDPTGSTDATSCIQAAINAVCANTASGGGIIYLPTTGPNASGGYAVTQAQGGSGSLAPVFTIGCSGITFRGGGSLGPSAPQFTRSPTSTIAVTTLGANPSAGPIFCLNACGSSNANNSITFEDLTLKGYNQALTNFATNTNLRNVVLSDQNTGFTGSGTTYTDNVALVQKGFWFEWNDGVLIGNVLMPIDNSGGGSYDQAISNIVLHTGQFIADVRQNFSGGIAGSWFFQNITRENATAGLDFLFLVNHTGNNCGTTALPAGVNDVTIDHFLDADAANGTYAIVHSDTTMAGCTIAGITIRNSIVGNAGAGLAIQMSGGRSRVHPSPETDRCPWWTATGTPPAARRL